MEFQDIKQLTIWSNEQKGREKIHFSLGELKKHYTFHFGCISKIADFHITDERFALGSPERHWPLFKISHFQILRLIVTMQKQIPIFMQWLMSQEVSAGILKKKHIMLLPIQQSSLFFDSSFDKKFRLKIKDFDEQHVWDNLICPHQLSSCDVVSFQATSIRYGFLRAKGIVYKIKVSEKVYRLFWFDHKEFLKVFQPIIDDFLIAKRG